MRAWAGDPQKVPEHSRPVGTPDIRHPGFILRADWAKVIKNYINTSISMVSGIVHSYFFRFRLHILIILTFCFPIRISETDHSAISLRVAAKARAKNETDPPLSEDGQKRSFVMAGYRNRQLQLSPLPLREDSSVNKVSPLHFTQNTPIYSRNKAANCFHGRYTYRLISWLLCRYLADNR